MIETTHVRIEQAAEQLSTTVDALLTAALENRLRLWATLFEWRDFEVWDFTLSRDEHGQLCEGGGREFFDFVPLFGWHVAALLKHGKVVTEVLSESDLIVKQVPREQSEEITVTRDEPLFVLAADLQRIKSEDGEPPAPKVQPLPPSGDRSHVSNQLAALNQAALKWWANADRTDPSTHTNNAVVAAWLEEKHGFKPSLAEKAASIVRPEWAHKGRKPEK